MTILYLDLNQIGLILNIIGTSFIVLSSGLDEGLHKGTVTHYKLFQFGCSFLIIGFILMLAGTFK